MKILRVIAVAVGIGLLLVAVPGLVVNLHNSWWENSFHILAFGGVATYAIYFGFTGRYKLPTTKRDNEVA
jgi:hypothetical protein